MPLVFAREELVECYMECDRLVRDYYASTKASEEVPPIDFHWPQYLALEHVKQIVLVTARNGAELAGFVLYVVSPHPHHKTIMMASCDTLAVRPEYRSMGIGRSLINAAEPMLLACGAVRVMHSFRLIYREEVAPLFPKLGFEPYEVVYSRELSAH